LEVNEALCQMLEYTREEILKMSVADVEAIDSNDQIEQRIQSVIQTGSTNFESCFRRKDGTVLDIEVSVTYLPKQDLLFGFHRDITERKRTEEALRESEIQFRANFESSPVALWEEDFSEVKTRLDQLRYAGIVDLGSYLDANPNEVTDLASKVRVLEINQASVRALGAESKEQIISDISYYFAEASL
jgi:PAS domain S-box-containing protein